MEVCNDYFDTDVAVVTNAYDLAVRADAPEATQPELVELKDGDTYTITLQDVQKTIN